MFAEMQRDSTVSMDNSVTDQTISLLGVKKVSQNGDDQQLERGTVSKGVHSRCPGQTDGRVTINVGGVIFQTFDSTLVNTPLCTDHRLKSQYYDEAKGEYFFDRDPEIFLSVLNYWRSGMLHLPLSRCGPQIKNELELWGMKEDKIQPCCWDNYRSGLQTIVSLKKLRQDISQDNPSQHKTSNSCGRLRLEIWYLLTKPSHSTAAKVMEYIAILFAMAAIFSFCASTHTMFRVTSPYERDVNSNTSLPTILNDSTFEMGSMNIFATSRSSGLHPALVIIDIVCLTFFTTEYLLRLICAPKLRKFLLSGTAFVDVVAILPDYVEILVHSIHPGGSTSYMIINLLPFLRLMRVCRIFRIIRRVPGLWIMMYTLQASYRELSLMILFLLVGTLLFSSVIFFVDDNKVFMSIPHSFWWAIVTMTTVGYGDMAPVTPLGQLVGSIAAVCGVLMLGFTVPSLVTNFSTHYSLMEYEVNQRKMLAKNLKL